MVSNPSSDEEDDFLEFRFANDSSEVLRYRTSDEDGVPSLIRHVLNGTNSGSLYKMMDASACDASPSCAKLASRVFDPQPSNRASVTSSSASFNRPLSNHTTSSKNRFSSLSTNSVNEDLSVEEAHQVDSEANKAGFDEVRPDNLAAVSQGSDNAVAASIDAGADAEEQDNDADWQPMQMIGSYEVYDDNGNLVVECDQEDTIVPNDPASGYTRVGAGDDARSITTLDEKTDFLFDAEGDDVESQICTTKSLLTESQKIAYVGLCRLVIAQMLRELLDLESKGCPASAVDSMRIWGAASTRRLYAHMDINYDEQLMIEQLDLHGLIASDLTPTLTQTQVVHNGHIVDNKPQSERTNAKDLHCESVLPKETEDLMHTSLAIDVRWTVLCDLFLSLLSDGLYDSRSRVLVKRVGEELGVSALDINQFERKVTEAMQLEENAVQNWTEEEIIASRRKARKRRKLAYVGLATLGGGLVIGLSAGLLAPLIGAGLAAGFATIGITGTSGFLAGAGGASLVTTAGVAVGATAGSRSMIRRMGSVKTFEFRPIYNNYRVNVIVTISGWMIGKEDDVRLPFSTVDPIMGDLLSVLWEPEMMQSMGETINIIATEALTQSLQQILGATILTTLFSALQLPLALSKLSYLLDNPWNVSLDRAWAAGKILADILMQQNLGRRPVTLVGYSLGARVIYSCLTELSRKKAYGLVHDVLIFGAPVVYGKRGFGAARSAASGQFINAYSTRDWVLGYLFRATSGGIGRVLGLAAIKDPSVKNFDATDIVEGHMNYRSKMPKLLKECGWLVISEEFDEYEDPDPEKLREKQRKLISKLQDDQNPKKKGFLFSLRKRKDEWLNQARGKRKDLGAKVLSGDEVAENTDEYLFDVDAIRKEVENLETQLFFESENDIDDEGNVKELGAPKNFLPSATTSPLLPELEYETDLERPTAPLTRTQAREAAMTIASNKEYDSGMHVVQVVSESILPKQKAQNTPSVSYPIKPKNEGIVEMHFEEFK